MGSAIFIDYPLKPSQKPRQNRKIKNRTKTLGSCESKDAYVEGFARFWKLYPKKVARAKAEAIWLKLKPSESLTTTRIRQAVSIRSMVSGDISARLGVAGFPATFTM